MFAGPLGEPLNAAPKIRIDTTRAIVRVGKTTFELEWRTGYLRDSHTRETKWEVRSGSDFLGYRDTLEEATRLAVQAAPVVVSLAEARARISTIMATLHDLERDPAEATATEAMDDHA